MLLAAEKVAPVKKLSGRAGPQDDSKEALALQYINDRAHSDASDLETCISVSELSRGQRSDQTTGSGSNDTIYSTLSA